MHRMTDLARALRWPRRYRPLHAALLVLALVLAACAPASAPSPSAGTTGTTKLPTIRMAYAAPLGDLSSLMQLEFMRQNVLKDYDKKYKVEWVATKGSTEAQTMIAAGEADIGAVAFTTVASAIDSGAAPDGFAIIASVQTDGFGEYYTNTWLVKQDSPLKSIKDLKGKSVAINQIGSGIHLNLETALRSSGLDPAKDVNIVEIGWANMGPTLREGKVDATAFLANFYAAEMAKGGLRPLFTTKEGLGTTDAVIFGASRKFLKENGDAVKAFLADYVRMQTWLMAPENRKQALEIAAEITKVPVAVYEPFLFTKKDYYRHPSACATVAFNQKPVDVMFERGIIKQKIDMSKVIDNSYLPGPCS